MKVALVFSIASLLLCSAASSRTSYTEADVQSVRSFLNWDASKSDMMCYARLYSKQVEAVTFLQTGGDSDFHAATVTIANISTATLITKSVAFAVKAVLPARGTTHPAWQNVQYSFDWSTPDHASYPNPTDIAYTDQIPVTVDDGGPAQRAQLYVYTQQPFMKTAAPEHACQEANEICPCVAN